VNNIKEKYNKIPQGHALAIISLLRKKGERVLPTPLQIIDFYEKNFERIE
jgi:hypothetical protein